MLLCRKIYATKYIPVESNFMEPIEPAQSQEYCGSGDMQKEIPETSSRVISGREDGTANRRPRETGAGYSGHGEKERKTEQAPRGPEDAGLEGVPEGKPEADDNQMLDPPTGVQAIPENPVEIGSSHEDKREAKEYLALGMSAYNQFSHTGDTIDLDRAIEHWGVAAALLHSSPTERLYLLNNLGCAYRSRFVRLGEISDLRDAINFGAEAVSFTLDGHPIKPVYLHNLGTSYWTRFRRIGELADLSKAIQCQAETILLTPDDHPDRSKYFNSLGDLHMARFRRLGEFPDLHKAIECQTEVVSLTPNDHPDQPGYLNDLGASYLTRLGHLGELSDLSKAIECQTKAISLTPDGHPSKPGRLGNLGVSYWTRFGRLGELPDLHKAIECQSEAVSLTPDGHPHKLRYLNHIGNSYSTRFRLLGELPDLSKAIECEAKAVSLTPDGHPDKSGYLNNLGTSHLARFRRLGELSDLHKAIECQAKAVSFVPNDHPDNPGYLNNLGDSYLARFQRLGELHDLEKAIKCRVKAALLTPDSHTDKPGRLDSLGVSYRTRFRRLGELTDLNKAIEYQAEAVVLTPDGHPDRPICLNNLGISYSARFERLGEPPDLHKAIECQAEAVSLTPDDHSDRPIYTNNLGDSYLARFRCLGELLDLSKAIEHQAQAVSLTPVGHPTKPAYLNNFGNSYYIRFQCLGELPDLNKAIEYQADAVSLTPDKHPDKLLYLNNLGDSYSTRFLHLKEISDREHAGLSFKGAAESLTGPPLVRFRACCKWAMVSSIDPMSSPLPAYQRAMSLIQQLVWIGTTIGRRYELVAEVSDLVTKAASYAISTGTYDLALEWLEAGRSIVWGQIAQLRTPFDVLSGHNPKLAEDLARVGRQLENAGSQSSLPLSPNTSGPGLSQEADTHVQLALKWDRLLEEIRLMQGFEDFLRSSTASQLLGAAKAHPIAIINLYESRCDALILHPDSDIISHVALPNFSFKDATSARSIVLSQVRDRKVGQRLIPPTLHQTTLGTLWSGIVKPVLDSLGYTRKLPVEQLPRITWCTTGLLSFLPLHTARSCDESKLSAFDLVISSYTPTINALLSSQSADTDSGCGILAVGQESTPGLTNLPYTTKVWQPVEAIALIRRQPSDTDTHRVRYFDSASADRVLSGGVRGLEFHPLAAH